MTPGGWETVRDAVRQRVGPSVYEAWFGAISGRIEGGKLVLGCPDRFSRDWIRGRYGRLIAEAASGLQSVEYEVDTSLGEAPPGDQPAPARTASTRAPVDSGFESFVSGPSNALALEAARAMARGETGSLSPLLLAGTSGVGKTHLCRAIRSSVGSGVIYRSAEEFTSEVTTAILTRQMESIRHRYRKSLNVLILEDVQFLAGKKATQVELFHTLDHALARGKAVVLSADRLPHEIGGLDPGLRSRIASGLVARIGSPEVETRRRILREKAACGGVRLPEECLEILAARPVESVRDLLAGLNQVVTRASLLRAPVTPELLIEALETVEVAGRPHSLEEVAEFVARSYGVTPVELRSPSRKRRIVRPRQLAMYLCRRYSDASLQEIGELFCRDHTSVRYAVETVERRVLEQPQLRYEIEALAARLSPRRPGSGAGRTPGTPRI
ncbi:MAG: chromosomal replication initiator protein DnaA [Myxococcota bacterium]